MAPLPETDALLSESSEESSASIRYRKPLLLLALLTMVACLAAFAGRSSMLRGSVAIESLNAVGNIDCLQGHLCKTGPDDKTLDAYGTARITYLSHDACKNACAADSGCTATEFRSGEQRCELHRLAMQDIRVEASYSYMHDSPIDPAEFTCCLKKACVCNHGHAISDASCPQAGQEKCMRCDPGYYLDGDICKACSANTNTVHQGDLLVTDSSDADELLQVTEVTGNLIIDNVSGLVELHAFSCLGKVGGWLQVSENGDLKVADYVFPVLETAGYLKIENNYALESMSNAFVKLSAVTNSLYLQRLYSITSLDGSFWSLSTIGDSFYFQNNGRTSTGWKLAYAFPSLTKVVDSMYFQSNEHLTLMTRVFNSLSHIGDTLYFQDLDHLMKVKDCFNVLKATSLAPGEEHGSFYIQGCCSKDSCSGLEIQSSFNSMVSADKFRIFRNDGLTLISSSFNGLTHTEGMELDISENNAAMVIDEDSFSAGLKKVDGYVKIQVGMSCLPKNFATLDVNHAPSEDFSIETADGTYDRSNFTDALCK